MRVSTPLTANGMPAVTNWGIERLYNTAAHEFCHLAVYAVDHSKTDMHGPLFKKWGALASRKFSHLGITVTRVHDYEIEYKYHLSCQTENCTYVWKQQTKPKRTEYLRCPRCRLGVLLQTKPTPRSSKLTDYNVFTKEHLSRIKRENPELPMKEAMTLLGQEWKAHKDGGMLSSTAGGELAASGGEWSSSVSAPKKYPLTSMMDCLKVVRTRSHHFLGHALTMATRFDFLERWKRGLCVVYLWALPRVLFVPGYLFSPFIFIFFLIVEGFRLDFTENCIRV